MRDFKILSVRLNGIEAKALDELAKENQISVSEAVRNLLYCAIDTKRRERQIRRDETK